MARPIEPNSGYNVHIHKIGKYRYASTQRMVKNKDGKKMPGHVHWGTVDENLRFVPNSKFLFTPKSEQDKFVFPNGWDLSLIGRGGIGDAAHEGDEETSFGASQAQNVPAPILDNRNRFYGATWLLDEIAERTGVRADLMATFGENTAIVDGILSIAMFLYTANCNLSRLAAWQELEWYPGGRILTSQAITLLQQSITEKNRIDFLKCRAARLGDDDLLSVDSTTKTSFHGKLIDVAWGKNKEGLKLPDTMEVVAYSIGSHMPAYYRTLPGNFPDARSIELICSDMAEAGFGKFIMVTDRAYGSVKNLEMFIRLGQRAIMCQKVSVGFALKQISALGTFEFVPEGFEYSMEHDLYCRQFDIPYKIRLIDGGTVEADRLRLNLYFDPIHKSRCLKQLDVSLAPCEERLSRFVEEGLELYSPEDVRAFEDTYDIYDLKWSMRKVPVDPERHKDEPAKRGRKSKYDYTHVLKGFKRNEQRFKDEKLTSGFRAIVTLGVDMDADEAMTHYALRAEQESDFEQWKSLMPCDREHNSSEGGKAGASFIQFVAKILGAQLRYAWRSSDALRKEFGSSLAILDEMRRIRMVEYADQQRTLVTPFIGKQLLVCKEMGLTVPDGCGKEYKSKKVDE